MLTCQKCNSARLCQITGKCSDCCGVTLGPVEWDGYVPNDIGVGGGDYIELTYCLECGQIQGEFPLEPSTLEKRISDQDVTDFYNEYLCQGYSWDYLPAVKYHEMIRVAKKLSYDFGNFVEEVIEFNQDQYPKVLIPSVETFVHMYNNNEVSRGHGK